MALTYNNLFEHELRKRIDEEIERVRETTANGQVSDWAAYQREVGKIAGLRMALTAADEAHAELEKR